MKQHAARKSKVLFTVSSKKSATFQLYIRGFLKHNASAKMPGINTHDSIQFTNAINQTICHKISKKYKTYLEVHSAKNSLCTYGN